VAVVSLVSSVSDYKKEGEFLKKQMIEINAKIVTTLREGKEEATHRNDLVVGDIIKIESGMNIPVDGVVALAVGCEADESAMTGESDALPKDTYKKCLARQREHEEDPKSTREHHDVPSPILLSGTSI